MFEVFFCGIDHTHESNFVYGIENHNFWLFLHLKTSALLHLPEGDVIAPANSAILYPPQDLIYYEANEETFCNSYMRFYTDEPCVLQSKVPLKTPILLTDPFGVDLIMRVIIHEKYGQYQNTDKTKVYMLKSLMSKLEESVDVQSISSYHHTLSALRYEIQLNPSFPWTIKAMSEKVHISPGYLQNLYKKEFGVSCMRDVVNSRISLAKELLSNTESSGMVISQLCGYQSVEHFCRQFKNETGITPIKFRKISREQKSER